MSEKEQKTLKEQIREKSERHFVALTEEEYIALDKILVGDTKEEIDYIPTLYVEEIIEGLVAELQKRIEIAEETQNMWYDDKVQGFLEAYREVLEALR